MSITVFYHDGLTWEQDYILNNLLAEPFAKRACLMRVINTNDLLALTQQDFKSSKYNILVFSSNLITFDQVLQIIKLMQPRILIHLSDEFGTKPEFNTLGTFVPLVLRQHHFASYPIVKNVHQIPLGYMTGFPLINNLEKLEPIKSRRYSWGFIGSIRENRREMIFTFQKSFPDSSDYFLSGGGIKVHDMAEVYRNCKFVLNGRGCVRLDCFRIYEAMLSGAIPVVVGESIELKETFLFDGEFDFPPFLCANDWKQAVEKCHLLLKSDKEEELQQLQTKNITWIHTHIDRIKKQIVSFIQ